MSNINFIVVNDSDGLKDLIRNLVREEAVTYSEPDTDVEVTEVWSVERTEDYDEELVYNASTPKPMRITDDTKLRITKMIRDLGVPANIKGYTYLRDAIYMALTKPEVVNTMTKVMYPEIARMNNTTPARVERAIRHAIEKAWSKGNNEFANKFFGYTLDMAKGKPTNSECIALIADSYRMGRDLR